MSETVGEIDREDICNHANMKRLSRRPAAQEDRVSQAYMRELQEQLVVMCLDGQLDVVRRLFDEYDIPPFSKVHFLLIAVKMNRFESARDILDDLDVLGVVKCGSCEEECETGEAYIDALDLSLRSIVKETGIQVSMEQPYRHKLEDLLERLMDA